ncbi:MAG: HEAT repeat domain-containing protein [Gemmatimonadota bacterium]|nr:HEAT repeat domain-containing protein [Gemmatimonadota bacterium]
MNIRNIAFFGAVALAAASCVNSPPEPTPEPARDTTTRAPSPDATPPFRTEPMVAAWGPLPSGARHAERARSYDLQHQIVRIAFDWTRHAVIGQTTLTVAPLDSAITVVALDAVEMKIGGVRGPDSRKLTYDYDGQALTIHLARAVRPKQRIALTVDYETEKPKKGAYFIDRKHVVWTQGETEDNRYWVPTFDYPSDKTTWEFFIRVQKPERALSNGKLAGVRDLPCKKAAKKSKTPVVPIPCEAEYHWVQDKPASTYLMTAVTGNFSVINDQWEKTPVDYWTYPDSVPAAKRGFGKTPEMVALFSKLTGVAYPWAKYDQVVAPDYIFGGMENVSATTQADDDILHPAWAEPESNAESLVSHELGHQWYGDLLTTRGWGDIWLNEGFATFMAQMWDEVGKGADEGGYSRLQSHEATIAADLAARRPIVFSNWDANPLELFFSGHIYPKGAAILQMMRHQLGDQLFWSAMHRYTTEHAYGNVTSADLEKAFAAESHRDWSGFFKQWVYGAGFPTFRVSFVYDTTAKSVTVTAQQTQPLDSLTNLFDADVDIEVLTDSGARNGVVQLREGKGSASLSLPSAPRSIRWNKGKWLLEESDFPRSTSMLAWQLEHDDDVTGRIEAARLLGQRKNEPTARVALDSAIRRDKFWAVRADAAKSLAQLSSDTLVRNILLDASADRDPRVRRAVVVALRGYPGVFTYTRLRVMALADLSWFVRADALAGYAKLMGERALPDIRTYLERDSWLDLARAGALTALKEVSQATAWEILPKYTSGLFSRSARTAAFDALMAQRKGKEQQLAQLLEPLLADDDLFIRITVAQSLGTLGMKSSVPALEARRKAEPESRVVNAIDAALAELKK